MRDTCTDLQTFATNRANLQKLLLPNSLVVVVSDSTQPASAAGALLLRQNSELFYLTGIAQEETVLVLYSDGDEDRLFVRQPTPEMEIREGQKLTKEEARQISRIARVEWLGDFWAIFHRLMCLSERVYLNLNERRRLKATFDSCEARFVEEVQRRYPLHEYQRLAPLIHRVRTAKSQTQMKLIEHGFGTTARERNLRKGPLWTDRTGKECFLPSQRNSKKIKRSTWKQRRAMPKR
jgi:Xaa-Pro aminopeptidase